MPHKAKLSIGATMKDIGWSKKTRRIDSVPHVGWHPPVGWQEEKYPETVLRKKADLEPEMTEDEEAYLEAGFGVVVEGDDGPTIADSLPRLSDNEPNMADFSGDAGEEGDEQPAEETAYVKKIHPDGREEVFMTKILMKHTGVYMKPTEFHPMGPMLEWDADEDIWFFHGGAGEE